MKNVSNCALTALIFVRFVLVFAPEIRSSLMNFALFALNVARLVQQNVASMMMPVAKRVQKHVKNVRKHAKRKKLHDVRVSKKPALNDKCLHLN